MAATVLRVARLSALAQKARTSVMSGVTVGAKSISVSSPLRFGVLEYNPSVLTTDLDDSVCESDVTFSSCSKLAKAPEKVVDAFPRIDVGGSIFEVKWKGHCDEPLTNYCSNKLHCTVGTFVSEHAKCDQKEKEEICKDYYDEITKQLGAECREGLSYYAIQYHLYSRVNEAVEKAEFYKNDKVKVLMARIFESVLGPFSSEFYTYVLPCHSTANYPNQDLALNVGASLTGDPNVEIRIKGITDAALVTRRKRQLMIGEGKQGKYHSMASAQLLIAMLAQCAAIECMVESLWGFTLNAEEYIIFRLCVMESEILVDHFPPYKHGRSFHNFLPLMGVIEHVANLAVSRFSNQNLIL